MAATRRSSVRYVVAVVVAVLAVGGLAATAGYYLAGGPVAAPPDDIAGVTVPATETNLVAAELRKRLSRKGFAVVKPPVVNAQATVTTTTFAIERGDTAGAIMLVEYQNAQIAQHSAALMIKSGAVVARAGKSVLTIVFGTDHDKSAAILLSLL